MEMLFAISMSITRNIHINIIYQISSTQELPQETRKIDT